MSRILTTPKVKKGVKNSKNKVFLFVEVFHSKTLSSSCFSCRPFNIRYTNNEWAINKLSFLSHSLSLWLFLLAERHNFESFINFSLGILEFLCILWGWNLPPPPLPPSQLDLELLSFFFSSQTLFGIARDGFNNNVNYLWKYLNNKDLTIC